VSDHDLMFKLKANKAVEGDADADDEDNIRFIEDRVRTLNGFLSKPGTSKLAHYTNPNLNSYPIPYTNT